MFKPILSISISIIVVFGMLNNALPVTASKNVVLSYRLNSGAKLILSDDSIAFAKAGLDTANLQLPTENPLEMTVKARTWKDAQVVLTVIADSDMVSGYDRIDISRVSWSASGNGFVGGSLSKNQPQKVGAWKGSGIRQGALNFFLIDDWQYPSGIYKVNLTFSLTVP